MWVSVCHYGGSGNAVTLCLLLAEPPAVSSACWEMFCKVFRRSVSHIVDSCMEFQLLQICCWFSGAVLDTRCLLVLDSHISTNRFFFTWCHNETIPTLTLPTAERFHSRPLLESTWIFKWSEIAACWSLKPSQLLLPFSCVFLLSSLIGKRLIWQEYWRVISSGLSLATENFRRIGERTPASFMEKRIKGW